jgi:hypothetical protein
VWVCVGTVGKELRSLIDLGELFLKGLDQRLQTLLSDLIHRFVRAAVVWVRR